MTSERKLGRLPATDRAKAVPKLGKYLATDGPRLLPARTNYAALAGQSLKRMYLNDRYGCCVISGKMHALGVWSANDAEAPVVLATDDEVLAAYRKLKVGWGDSGCVITTVLDHMVRTGLTAAGRAHKLDGYVAIDWTNVTEAKTALVLFGGLTLGIDIPDEWVKSPDGADWGPTGSKVVGGHDVEAVDYDEKGVVVSTWGGTRRILWEAFTSKKWVVECYGKLAPLWYGADGIAKALGRGAADLAADLAVFRSGGVPDLDPPEPVSTLEEDVAAALRKAGWTVTK